MIDPLYSLSGFAVGLLVGMTGVGGGSLMTPILILLFGVRPCHGGRHRPSLRGRDQDRWQPCARAGAEYRLDRGEAAAQPAAFPPRSQLSAPCRTLISAGKTARNLITLVLSIALFATAFVLVFGNPIVAAYRARVGELDARRTARNTVLVGIVLGTLVSISSVGAGALGVIALIILYPHLPDGENRWLRYRARRAADADCRRRTLDDGIRRLAHYGFAAGRLASRHFCRQLFRNTRPRARPQACPRDDTFLRRKSYRLRLRQRGRFDLYGTVSVRGRIGV